MKQNITVAIVEDDRAISEILEDNLRREGYRIQTYFDGAAAHDGIFRRRPDLIILDLNLPSISGIELCKYLRTDELTAKIPIIMLTARSEEIDKIIGFEVGADDYVTKPFSPRELLARVKALLRRIRSDTLQEFNQGVLKVNFDTHEVYLNGEPVSLTPIQFKLLKELIQNHNRAISRQNLLDAVWGEDYYGDPRTVDVHITRLREKLGAAAGYILTVRGAGYRWKMAED